MGEGNLPASEGVVRDIGVVGWSEKGGLDVVVWWYGSGGDVFLGFCGVASFLGKRHG
jgi:hypothetical protein